MGGFGAVARLLRHKSPPKILILSAYITGFVLAHLLDLCAADYLSKRASLEEPLVKTPLLG